MNTYELVLIFSSALQQEEQKKIISKLEKSLTEEKGRFLSQEEWGKKSLAYPIKKQSEGMYWLIKLEADAKSAVMLHETLRLDDKVLRHLIIKGDNKAKSP